MENKTSDNPGKQVERPSREITTAGGVLETATLVLIILISVLGNVFICHVIRKNRRLHCFVFVFVFSQAVSDMLMAVFVMPLTALTLSTGKWMTSDFICSAQGTLILTFSLTSLHTMALIAVNRFFRAVKPHLYRRFFTKRSVAAMITFIWLLAVVWSLLPLALNWGSFFFHLRKSTCFIRFRDVLHIENTVYTAFTMFLYVLLPIVVISHSYWKIFKIVKHHQAAVNPLSNGNYRLNVEEVKVIRILFAIMIGFAVCWIPVIIFEAVDTALGDLPRAAHLAYIYLAFVSCSICPLIYITMHRQFRTELCRLFHVNCSQARVQTDNVS